MSVYKKKNGKWYCRFQLNGERHHKLCTGAKTAKEAEQIETAFKYRLQQQQNGVIPRELGNVAFGTLRLLYLKHAENNCRSYKNIVYYVKVLEGYFGNGRMVQKIKPNDIETFKQEMLSKGKKHSTVNRYLEILSKMFNLGISNQLIAYNPVNEVKKLLEDNHKIRYLTKEEERRLYSVLPPWLKPIVTVALKTGMRRGEIFHLKWDNIDFDFGFIDVLETKSGKARKIPFSDKLREVFDSLDRLSEYVFTNPKTLKPYVDIKKAWATALREADIKNLRFHDLRHTFATRLVEKGVPLPVVQELLGHAKISTTMRYAHVIPHQKIEAIAVLDSYN